jgi:hypothetical protein
MHRSPFPAGPLCAIGSQIAIRSSGLNSHLMMVADGIQLGSLEIL